MAGSRKPRSASAGVVAAAQAVLERAGKLRGKRFVAGLSGGIDSVVLLHVLQRLAPKFGFRLSALHVNHGLSVNAKDWENFCRALCQVPFAAKRVKVKKQGKGLEAAARDARRAAFTALRADAVAFGHHLDDQAETVLFNLLRGTGPKGASGMAAVGKLGSKTLLRPLLDVPRSAIADYAAENGLGWIEDESNRDEALTRNFLRRRVGPLLEQKFPRWRESLARAARHFAAAELDERRLLREFLAGKGLRAPSEAKLLELLKQLRSGRTSMEHEGSVVRVYRGKTSIVKKISTERFKPMSWQGESSLRIPALQGEIRFKKVRGKGIDTKFLRGKSFRVDLRSGGERLQLDARRPRRTLKNLFQESGVPPWERERLPLLYCGDDLAWVPGLGVDAAFATSGRAYGLLPEWRPSSS